jgi:hypothetical protein
LGLGCHVPIPSLEEGRGEECEGEFMVAWGFERTTMPKRG